MDLSKLKTSDWMKVGGALLFLIAFFLKWWKADAFDFGYQGSDYFFTGIIPFILVVGVGVLAFLAATDKFHLPDSMPAPLVFVGASALGTLLVLLRLFGPGHGVPDGAGISRGVGLYLALIGAIIVLIGSIMGFTEAGGDLNDLKDMNKIRGSFQGGRSSAPPPPPPPPPRPGTTPPPPPPPPG